MKFQDTNEFNAPKKNNANKIFLSIAAVVFALLAIVVAVLISVAMNIRQTVDNPTSTEAPVETTLPPETTKAPDTTATDTTVSIIPDPGTPINTGTTANDDPIKKPPMQVDGKFTVCVDPGHGYDDPGAVSDFLGDVTESEIVMGISQYLKDYLLSYGYKVVMTHEDNVPPAGTYGQYLFNPKTRIAYANSNFEYDYYISVHCNSYGQEYVSGTRIYYHAPSNKNNSEITTVAECLKAGIASVLNTAKTPSRHPLDTQDAYYVCRYAKSLATMLVETGFVTNKGDAEKMLDDQWRKDMAKGIADGIHAYLTGLN